MIGPDERAFLNDVESGPFKIGVAAGQWDLAEPEACPSDSGWPTVVLWVATAPRQNAPDRFHIRMDCQQYPNEPPTGTFWDPVAKTPLAIAARPKGRDQVAKVFRVDWEGGRAFYHPYDRVAAKSHGDWPTKYPHLVWDRNHTVVDLLIEIYRLLNCNDYTGV